MISSVSISCNYYVLVCPHVFMCVCVCVRACVRASVRARACMCVLCVRACVRVRVCGGGGGGACVLNYSIMNYLLLYAPSAVVD